MCRRASSDVVRKLWWTCALGLALACTRPFQAFPLRTPLARDLDRRPFQAQLEPAYSPRRWDAIYQSAVRPVVDALAVDPGGEAVNVNALDEVPDSSWFENRSNSLPMSAAQAARGPCPPSLELGLPWSIVSGKPDGSDPGFVIKAPDGRRYLIKLDEPLQGVRTSVADVVGSLLYHAAGFAVPCNTIVAFDPAFLRIAPRAKTETSTGQKIPLTWQHVEAVLGRAKRDSSGLYRGVASRYLDGHPLGPWNYHGLRVGDRNDVVPHEDRRELRASRLLAAWTDHSDQRAQNTLAMWIETAPGRGYVQHHLLDFGDCFGSLWEGPAQQAWHRGHAYWFDPQQMLADFFTFGALERPWDRALLGPSGTVFGYFGARDFSPEDWHPTYPNPAFGRMTERDAAWMARILTRMGPPQIDAMVRAGQLEPRLHAELVLSLLGRRRAILARYLTRLSPIADVTVQGGGTELCATDLAVASGIAPLDRTYRVRAWKGPALEPLTPPALLLRGPGLPCVRLGDLPRRSGLTYWIIELMGTRLDAPLRIHLYETARNAVTIAGIERPESEELP